MAQPMRRKISLSTSLSPKIGTKIDNAMEAGGYASQSDLLQIALTEYFTREEIREYQDKLIAVYQKLVKEEEGRKLLDGIPKDLATRIEALKKKGMACVELGEFDEAEKCFAKAKELESGKSTEQKKNTQNPRKIEYKSLKDENDDEEEILEEFVLG
jgi:Arc/MetJ-type ribon-helix-helix transcriptional regulator